MKNNKQAEYLKLFTDRATAREHMRLKNNCNCVKGWLWVLTDGPSDDFAVMDIGTAIEMDLGYEWATV